MRVTVRKGPPHLHTHKVPVVLEVWLEHEGLDPEKVLEGPALKDAMKACLREHMKSRLRVSRQVGYGGGDPSSASDASRSSKGR